MLNLPCPGLLPPPIHSKMVKHKNDCTIRLKIKKAKYNKNGEFISSKDWINDSFQIIIDDDSDWNDETMYTKTKSIFYPDLSKFNQPLVKLGAFSDDFCQEVYESAVLFIRAMSNSRYQMVALYLDNVRSYTLTLDNGTLLILGRGQQKALTRLKRFLEAFGHSGLNSDDVEYVDLRYDVGFAVGKKSQS